MNRLPPPTISSRYSPQARGVVLHLLASGLTILATLALLGAAALLTETPLAAPASPVQAEAIYRFYDAVNSVLRTGDPTALAQVVSPDLLLHPSAADTLRAMILTSGDATLVQAEAATTLLAGEDPAVVLAITVLPQHEAPARLS